MAIGVLQALHQVTSGSVPHADALVQGSGSHVAAIGGHGHGGDTIFNAQSVDKLTIENIPQAHSLVTTARSNETAVTSKVQRVNILLVTTKDVLNSARVDIPNLWHHVSGACRFSVFCFFFGLIGCL